MVNRDGGNSVTVINTATNTVVTTVPIGLAPFGPAITPDGSSLWVADATGTIWVIDTATHTVSSSFNTNFPGNPNSMRPVGIAFTPDGAFAYLSSNFGAHCVVIDTATKAVVADIPTGNGPWDNIITASGSTVYQVNRSSNSVSVIDTATNTVTATVPVGAGPEMIDLTPDEAFAYVANTSGNTVSVFNTATNTVVATVPVGAFAFGVAVARAIEVPPDILSANATVTVDEGQTAINNGFFRDLNRDPVTLTASVGTVVKNANGTWSWSFLTSDGPTQSQTVTITANDGQGGTSSTSFSLVVNNVPPTITSVSNNSPVFTGNPANITVAATDPAGANDPLTYSFDCNNDGTFEIGPQAANSATCTFATAGSYTVNVRVADGDGGVATSSTVVTVILPAPNCLPAPPGMVGWWTGDNNTIDLIAADDGTLFNGATFTPAGQVDEAFLLDGVDDYVSAPDTPALSLTTTLTLSAWVRTDNTSRGDLQTIVSKPRHPGGTGYSLSLFPGGRPDLGLNNEVSFNCVVISPVPVVSGEWTHVAGTWNAATSEMKIYLNGQLRATNVSCATSPIQDSSQPLEIGREALIDGGRHFDGAIDEVQVYNHALTAQEIMDLYTAGTHGTCKAPFLFSRLRAFIVAAAIPSGIKNALLQKLDNASASYTAGNLGAAANQMSALINQTEAQAGKKISPADASQIIAEAQQIIDQIGG